MRPSRETYDPAWAVALFRDKLDPSDPERETILLNLENCREVVGYCDCGCGDPYFIDPESADWKPARTPVCMTGTKAVILDVMSNLRIGSIETLDLEALAASHGSADSVEPKAGPDAAPGGRS